MKSENYVAYGNLILFIAIALLAVLALSGFGWAGYSFFFLLFTIFVICLIKRKISFSGNVRFPGSLLIVRGVRAVVISILFLLMLTIIFLLFKTNIMELFVLGDYNFQHKINFVNLFIGLPIGIIIGLLQSKLTDSYEEIFLQKYNTTISGN